MILILDSNIWLSEFALNSTLGAVTRFYIRQNKVRIALPEVVRLEVEHNLRNSLRDFVSKIADNHRKLLTIFGSLKEVVLPNDFEINQKATQVFSDLGLELFEVPFSIESARSSFIKTIDKSPPSDRTQEFKDGVIWADCCYLLEQDDVVLVTGDLAFYSHREYSRGLAINLKNEINSKNKSFKIFRSLSELLTELKTDVPINKKALVDTLLTQQKESIEELLALANYQLSDTFQVEHTAYITEKSNILYLEFKADITTHDLTSENRPDGLLTLPGNGNLNTESGNFVSIYISEEELSYYQQNGEHQTLTNAFHSSIAYLGHKEVVHHIREKLI